MQADLPIQSVTKTMAPSIQSSARAGARSGTDFKSVLRGQAKETIIASFTLVAIGISLSLRFGVKTEAEVYGLAIYQLPLLAALLFGGIPLVFDLLVKIVHAEFGSDLLAGM